MPRSTRDRRQCTPAPQRLIKERRHEEPPGSPARRPWPLTRARGVAGIPMDKVSPVTQKVSACEASTSCSSEALPSGFCVCRPIELPPRSLNGPRVEVGSFGAPHCLPGSFPTNNHPQIKNNHLHRPPDSSDVATTSARPGFGSFAVSPNGNSRVKREPLATDPPRQSLLSSLSRHV